MHDLETALAELISVTEGPAMGRPWVPADFVSDTTGEAFATVVATVLNAVLSGDLIPKALLAAANEAAADFVGNEAPSFPDEVAWCVEDLAQAIRTLTPADAQAALDAMISRAREGAITALRDAYACQLRACAEWEAEMAKARGVSKRKMMAARYAGHRSAMNDLAERIAALRANATDASEGER